MIKKASKEQIKEVAQYIAMKKQAGLAYPVMRYAKQVPVKTLVGQLPVVKNVAKPFIESGAKQTAKQAIKAQLGKLSPKAQKILLGIGGGTAAVGVPAAYAVGKSQGRGEYDTLKNTFDTQKAGWDKEKKGLEDRVKQGSGSFWADLWKALQNWWSRLIEDPSQAAVSK